MTRRVEIFAVLCEYSLDHLGNSPSIRDLLSEMRKRGYKMSFTTLYEHLLKLETEQVLERRDGKLIVVNSEWTPPDG
jgi:Fe2+ or Zn2+ uptake regulation protein